MANLDSVHDKLCWAAFEDVEDAIGELRSVLPAELVARVDWSSLVPLPERFVDEVMRGSQADRLYQARYGQGDALIYVLWEHKSEVDQWTLLQLLRYMVRIWEHCLAQRAAPATLPPIIPVIVHHSETGWKTTTKFQELFDRALVADGVLGRFTPAFEAVVDDISFAGDEELRLRGLSPRATLGLVFLRDGRREGRILEELGAWADLFRALLNSPNGRRAILQLFSYLYGVTPNLNRSALEETVRQVIPEAEEIVMTLAEQLIQQGISQGLSQGLSQGISQGLSQGLSQGISQGLSQGLARQRYLLRRQLELKFGALPSDILSVLDSADDASLEQYAERVVLASSLSEVFAR